jgi:hypothetical protein
VSTLRKSLIDATDGVHVTTDRHLPTPADLAQVIQRAKEISVPALPQVHASDGVLFTYVDNSNIWIEGQRIMAVREGLAKNPYDAMKRRVTAPWVYDFGRLYEIACPPGSRIGRSLLVGSRPPTNDSVWKRAEREGFQVELFDRNAANKEKQVDSSLGTTMVEDSYEHMRADRNDMAVLVAGDTDFLPNVRSLQKRNIRVRVVCWKHATGRELREVADEYVELDGYFEWLTVASQERHKFTP